MDCQSIWEDFRQFRDDQVSLRLAVAAVPRVQFGKHITEHPYKEIVRAIHFTTVSNVECVVFIDKDWERMPDKSAAEDDSDGEIDDVSATTFTDEADECGSTLESTKWPYDFIHTDEANVISDGIVPVSIHYRLEGETEEHTLNIDDHPTLKVSDPLYLHREWLTPVGIRESYMGAAQLLYN